MSEKKMIEIEGSWFDLSKIIFSEIYLYDKTDDVWRLYLWFKERSDSLFIKIEGRRRAEQVKDFMAEQIKYYYDNEQFEFEPPKPKKLESEKKPKHYLDDVKIPEE